MRSTYFVRIGSVALLYLLMLNATNVWGFVRTNLGLITWNKVVFDAIETEQALTLIEQFPTTENIRRRQVDGTLYWISTKPEKAISIVAKDKIAEQLLRVADLYISTHEFSRAEKWLKYTETTEQCQSTVWYQRGKSAEAQHQWNAAISAYQQAVKHPLSACDWYGHSDAFYRIGHIYQQYVIEGTSNLVVDAYSQATHIGDFNSTVYAVDSYFQLGLFLFRKGPDTDEQAVAALTKALHLQPDHKWALLTLGRSLYRYTGNFDESLALIQRAYHEDETSNWLFPFYLAELYNTEKRYEEAVHYYRVALEASPGNTTINERIQTLPETLP